MELKKVRSRSQGFSLVELMVVITVIGILATFVVLNVGDLPDKAKITAVKQDFSVLKQAVSLYRTTHGQYPTSYDDLTSPPEDPITGESNPLIDEVPYDPWLNEEYPWEEEDGKPYFISYGADGTEGGEGINSDIDSRDLKGRGNR